jgi:hypothetical protein
MLYLRCINRSFSDDVLVNEQCSLDLDIEQLSLSLETNELCCLEYICIKILT